jgi:hypothetical protein
MKKNIILIIVILHTFLAYSQRVDILDTNLVSYIYNQIINDQFTYYNHSNFGLTQTSYDISKKYVKISKGKLPEDLLNYYLKSFKLDSQIVNLNCKKNLTFSKINLPFKQVIVNDPPSFYKIGDYIDKNQIAELSMSEIYFRNNIYYIIIYGKHKYYDTFQSTGFLYEFKLCELNGFPIFLSRSEILGFYDDINDQIIEKIKFSGYLECKNDHK